MSSEARASRAFSDLIAEMRAEQDMEVVWEKLLQQTIII